VLRDELCEREVRQRGEVPQLSAHHGSASPAAGTREDHATDARFALPERTSQRRFSTRGTVYETPEPLAPIADRLPLLFALGR
jgi:hypothetical protein